MSLEIVLKMSNGPRAMFTHIFFNSTPLCAYMVWFVPLAAFPNSDRLMRLLYPLALIGGLFSLVVVDYGYSFPHLNFIIFWVEHSLFSLMAMYFVFTKKINKYTLEDLGNSFITILFISLYVYVCCSYKMDDGYSDPLYVFGPPGSIKFIKDSIGQYGYTILYIMLVAGLFFAFYGLTYLCTRKRDDEYCVPFEENKFGEILIKMSPKARHDSLFGVYGIGIYIAVLNRIMEGEPLKVLDLIMFIVFETLISVNEYADKHLKDKNKHLEKESNEENIIEMNDEI